MWESITTQKSPADLRQSFRKLQKRRSTFITVEGVEYRICMERLAKERCDSKQTDYVLASVEALKGSSAEVTSLSDHEDASTYVLSQAAGRLRGIIALVNSGYLTMEILLQNLEAAARLLEGDWHVVKQIKPTINRVALYAVESNQNGVDSDDNEEYQAVRKISATEEIPDEVKNWLTETFVRTNVIKNIGKFLSLIDTRSYLRTFSCG